MMDNLESNNVAIYEILKVLRPDIKDYASRRGRCLRHIINLAAKAFIFGKDSDLFEADISTYNDLLKIEKARALWRTKGLIGKFYNTCVYIQATPQRRESFESCCSGITNSDLDGKFFFNCGYFNNNLYNRTYGYSR